MTARSRPWRARAYWPVGDARVYAARTSACSQAGLDRFVERWAAQGAVVELWELRPIPQVEQLVLAATSPPGK